MVKVWCEWDMGLYGVFGTFGNHYTIYKSMEDAINDLKEAKWSEVGYNSWEEAKEDGLLSITEENISNKKNGILFNTEDFDSLSRRCLLAIEEIKNDKNVDLNNNYVLKLINFIEEHYQVIMLFDTNEKNYTTKFLKEFSDWNQYIEELVWKTRLAPSIDNKMLNFKDLNLFFNTVRKANIEMDINVTNNEVSFIISKEKPFIQDNWDKTISKMIETKEITNKQALAFSKLIKTKIYKIK